MDKRIIVCLVVVISLVFVALLANTYLEIYPSKKYVSPSSEVYLNGYYAMEKWLNETGNPVRVEAEYNFAEIAAASEKTAVVFSRGVQWEEVNEYLLPWIESGNSLVICINNISQDYDDALAEFIKSFGIEAEETSFDQDAERNTDGIPNFDMSVNFLVDESFAHSGDAGTSIIEDNNGFARLIEVSIGEGKLFVTGTPYFMQNFNLKKEMNANLAWRLTGALAAEKNSGILFVRPQYNRSSQPSPSMLEKIMEKGNLVPVGISAALVILLGFWSVIPVFGLVFHEKQKSSRPITERFSAEISFLKKYKALNYYLEIYNRELQTDINNEKEKNYQYREIINKIRSVYDGTDKLKRGIRGFKIRAGKE